MAVGQDAVLFGRIFVSTCTVMLDGLTVVSIRFNSACFRSLGILVHCFKIVQNKMSRHTLHTMTFPVSLSSTLHSFTLSAVSSVTMELD